MKIRPSFQLEVTATAITASFMDHISFKLPKVFLLFNLKLRSSYVASFTFLLTSSSTIPHSLFFTNSAYKSFFSREDHKPICHHTQLAIPRGNDSSTTHRHNGTNRDHQDARPRLQSIRRRRSFPRTRTKTRSSYPTTSDSYYTIFFIYTTRTPHHPATAQEHLEENFAQHHHNKKISSIQCSANKNLSSNIRRPMLFLRPSTFIRLGTHFGTDHTHREI